MKHTTRRQPGQLRRDAMRHDTSQLDSAVSVAPPFDIRVENIGKSDNHSFVIMKTPSNTIEIATVWILTGEKFILVAPSVMTDCCASLERLSPATSATVSVAEFLQAL